MVTTDLTYLIGDVARMSGTTVRTLHHYESVGVLTPSGRTPAGYRLYTNDDLGRLARILYYRDLDFDLETITALLDGTNDPVEHLREQHRLLSERLARVTVMVAAIEKEMNAQMNGHELTAEQKLEIFGDDYDPAYEVEAEQRWGDTEAWRQSQERTASFTEDDWRRIKSETDAFNARLAEAFTSGVKPGSEVADGLAEEHLASLRTYYDADYEMHRNIASLYTDDARYAAPYEALASGLSGWLREIIDANAAAHG